MLGNDVVNLELARQESNWKRTGFLNKIFTKNEQILIQNSDNQMVFVWILWSMKESVYKIWNRKTGLRKFNPTQLECFDLKSNEGKVRIDSKVYFTKTEVTNNFIHTIAVTEASDFDKIKYLDNNLLLNKINGIPFYVNENKVLIPVSKSHHGALEFIIGF